MAKNMKLKPIAAALGTTFAVTLAASPLANATENPFSVTSFDSGYMVAGDTEGKCGEGKCGGDHDEDGGHGDKAEAEGKCGEGKCGGDHDEDGGHGDKAEAEGKCGEGKCGGDK